MRKLLAIWAACLVACAAFAGGSFNTIVTVTTTTGVNSAWAQTFSGEIEEIGVYPSTGATGSVYITAYDSLRDSSVALGTNAACKAFRFFKPRFAAPPAGGATAYTNNTAVTNPRYYVSGQKVKFTVTSANAVGKTFTFRLVWK